MSLVHFISREPYQTACEGPDESDATCASDAHTIDEALADVRRYHSVFGDPVSIRRVPFGPRSELLLLYDSHDQDHEPSVLLFTREPDEQIEDVRTVNGQDV